MDAFADRRERFFGQMGDGVAVVPAAPVAIRNHDVEHTYRQHSDLYYLTGFAEPESVLVLTNQHPDHRVVMFVRPRDKDREIWDGLRAGVDGAVADFGADAAFPIAELAERLPDYLGNVQRLLYRVGEHPSFDNTMFATLNQLRRGGRKGVAAPTDIIDPGTIVHEMRLHKDDTEIASMKRAAAITAEAHRAAMRAAAPGMFEYQIEAELLHTFRKNGSERPAYDSIVGSGPNATILHYHANNRKMADGDLLLIDAGCEFEYYASDVTRTFPVSGRFSAEQKSLYELVLRAQAASIEAVGPGATLEVIHDAAVQTLTEGLRALSILEGELDELIANKAYEPFYMHRTSHWLGMDVHDVGRYHINSEHRALEPRFVLTVEPGLYFAVDADVDEKWRGIGIRIEDDVLVTETGHEVLTQAIPKTVDDVEAACA